MKYIDLHTHTSLSDGSLSPQELAQAAKAAGIRILAITDHNSTEDLADLRAQHPDIRFIQGSEITCLYSDSTGKKHELHVVALGFDPYHPAMLELFRCNQPDRRPYINRILERLRDHDIHIGTYEDLQKANPESHHFGRMQIAIRMKEHGYVASINEAFDRYLGAHGERLAYVPNPLHYVSLEQAISAILAAGGIPVLAHLFYYRLSAEENLLLVHRFRDLAGEHAAMEVEYGHYDRAQRDALGEIADRCGLLWSCASDYHGSDDTDTLAYHFPVKRFRPLLDKLTISQSH